MSLYRIFLGVFTPLSVTFIYYIQINGSYGAGGAFQAGVLLASLFSFHLFFMPKLEEKKYEIFLKTALLVVFICICAFFFLFSFSYTGKEIYNWILLIEWCIFYNVFAALSSVTHFFYIEFYKNESN